MTTAGAIAATFCSTLVDEWVRAGVRHAIIAPGSRSTPLALACMREPAISVEVFHDERSAGFAALGIGLSTGIPAVVLCSSGTAGAHFYAAVIEAHMSSVPLIVCTADRPPHLRDISSPQTIDQIKMFGDFVRWFHDPGVPNLELRDSWRPLASRVFFSTLGSRPGPVHLNLPFDEPLFGESLELPDTRESVWSTRVMANGWSNADVETFAHLCANRSGVFIAGKGSPTSLVNLAMELKWPVLADPRSGLRIDDENVVIAFDSILRVESFAKEMTPEVVVFVGEPPASKILSQWVRNSQAKIIHLGPTEVVVDPLQRVAASFVGDLNELCEKSKHLVRHTSEAALVQWKKADLVARGVVDTWVSQHWSEIAVAHTVSRLLFAESQCVVSSSMPIRDFEWFGGVIDGAVVHANRGANGIDGVVSTSVGIALGSGQTTFLLIGDIACIHDSNGLWDLARRNVDLKIVVTNNDGGAIFSFLPQADHVDSAVFERIYGTPHGVSFAALAQTHGIEYRSVASISELELACSRRGPIIIEAKFDRALDVSQHEDINRQVRTAVETLKA
jgi:2-succinyl-5-enolpyruvyl-6-hydroxy-3-cyclohexene-1-carboxylate synthase